MYDENDLEYLLGKAPFSEVGLDEDLLILQPDGSRACLNWEIRGKGYHLDSERRYGELSGEELLKDAYLEIEGKGYKV